MSLNTYPYNSFPASTDKLDEAHNAELQQEIDTVKSGLTDLDNELNGDATVYPYADVITIPDAVPSNLADCSVKIEPVQSGSGDPSPTNVRPISGHTEASVQRDGRNQCPVAKMNTLNSDTFKLNAGTYTISFKMAGSGMYSTSSVILRDDSNANVLSVGVGSASSGTVKKGQFTLQSEKTLHLYVNNITASTGGYYIEDIQIELGQTATPYVPFAGKTYTIALGSTIYGGTVDFNTGVMTVDRVKITPTSTTDIRKNTAEWPTNQFVVYPNEIAKANGYIISDRFKTIDGGSDVGVFVASNGRIRVNTANSYQSASDALAGEFASSEFCYELATTTTIQLTPQQIQLLQGQNTLYASTGQISVTSNGVSGSIGQVQEQVNDTDAALAELAEQLPTAPTTDGAYVLTVTVADGTPTYSWESAT